MIWRNPSSPSDHPSCMSTGESQRSKVSSPTIKAAAVSLTGAYSTNVWSRATSARNQARS